MGPATTKFLKTTTPLVGGVFKGIGQIGAGIAAFNSASLSSTISRQNADILDQASEDALDAGAIKKQERQVQREQDVGTARSGQASRNVVVDRDTAFEHEIDIRRIAHLDADQIELIAQRQALGFRRRADISRVEADLAEKKGLASLVTSGLKGAGTLLSTAGKVASKWKVLTKQFKEI